MKLLLTSSGLSNPSIAKALLELAGKPASQTKIAFVPTAMNAGEGHKGWFIKDLANIDKQGFACVDIVDISALPRDAWEPRLKAADVLFFSGGDSSHLMRWINESGLKDLLPEWMRTKVWAGISAGSMVTNPGLDLSSKDREIYYEKNSGHKDTLALGFVNFYIRPHFNSSDFPNANKEYLEEVARNAGVTIYALDDMSAVKVVDGRIDVVSEGEYLALNKK